MDDSRNNIDIIGAISLTPGFMNHIEPNIPKIVDIKKYFINLLLMIFDKQ